MSKVVEQALLQAARVVEEQLDAEIERLDALQGDDLEEFRQKRLQEMKKEASQREEWLKKGHGQYTELSGEKEFFEECKANERVVCHFYRDTTLRCKIVDKHLSLLAPKHLETKFVKLNVERAPFLCERLPIRILPTIASVIGGKTKDYIKGFDELGGHDDFTTEVLEWRMEEDEIEDDIVYEEVLEDGEGDEDDLQDYSDNMTGAEEELRMPEEEVEEGDEDRMTQDDSLYCFRQHTGAVFSVAMNPAGALVCSGGEDDRAYVWKPEDGTILFECKGHKDSVTCTGFSYDGKYVSTADMAGTIQVWDASTGELKWSFECGDLEWTQWHPQAHVLLAGTADGTGWMWKVPSGDCKTFERHCGRNTCVAILSQGKCAAFGYEDGAVQLWDLKEARAIPEVSGHLAHTSCITCMVSNSDGNLLLTGSEDATAKLTNGGTGKVLATFDASEGSSGEEQMPVEAVAFSTSLPVALTGSLSGVLGVWDLSTQKLRQQCRTPEEGGIVCIHSSDTSPVVYVADLCGVVSLYDVRSGSCERQWFGHSEEVLDMAVAKNETQLVTGSNDMTARVYSINR
eukprot:Em0022g318a